MRSPSSPPKALPSSPSSSAAAAFHTSLPPHRRRRTFSSSNIISGVCIVAAVGLLVLAKTRLGKRSAAGVANDVALNTSLDVLHQPSIAVAAQLPNQGVVVITDNPFLIPNLPKQRKDELSRAVRMNLDSPYVQSLHLLNQAPNNQTLYPGGKLHVYNLGWRSTFLDAIRYANAVLPAGTTFVVSNADIVFAHESVRLVTRIKPDADVVVALSRHEVQAFDRKGVGASGDRATLHPDPSLSQDAWFMRTPFPEDPGFDFPMGTLGSDNKLAHLYAHTLNKTVVNWCADVVIWHFHASQHRSAKARIPQPYRKVPRTRVNVSMLATSWSVRAGGGGNGGGGSGALRRHPPPQSALPATTTLQTIALDLPRISGPPLLRSNIKEPTNRPEWTPHAVKRMVAAVKRRARIKASLDRGGAARMHGDDQALDTPSRHFYFVDAPWEVLVRDRDFMRLRGPKDWLEQTRLSPTTLDHTFALIPEEAVPVFCRSAAAPAWHEMMLGTIDAHGKLTGEVVCPPMVVDKKRRKRRRRRRS